MHFVGKALRKSTSSGNKRSVPVATVPVVYLLVFIFQPTGDRAGLTE